MVERKDAALIAKLVLITNNYSMNHRDFHIVMTTILCRSSWASTSAWRWA